MMIDCIYSLQFLTIFLLIMILPKQMLKMQQVQGMQVLQGIENIEAIQDDQIFPPSYQFKPFPGGLNRQMRRPSADYEDRAEAIQEEQEEPMDVDDMDENNKEN